MGAGKYVVRIYDVRSMKTKSYLGPYKTKAEALKSAKTHDKAIKASKKHKHLRVGVIY